METGGRLASAHEKTQPLSLLLDQPGDHPPVSHDVYPLPEAMRNAKDLLLESIIEISRETVRFWWNRFRPMFSAET